MKRKTTLKTIQADLGLELPPGTSANVIQESRAGSSQREAAGPDGTPSPVEAEAVESEQRIGLARSRIALDYYSRAHVRNRILKAILERMDADD